MRVIREAKSRIQRAWRVLRGVPVEDWAPQSRNRNTSVYQSRKADTRPFDLERDIPRYPSYMEGLPTIPAKKVLQTQQDLVQKIRYEFEVESDEQWAIFDAAIRRFAEVVHLLPASETDHHAQPGGLFRHGLEVAHLALKHSHNFAPFARSEYAERRKELNIRFRYAVMIAALCHDIGKPITDINVTNATGDIRWNPFGASLPVWGGKNGVERYFIYWNRGRHRRHEPASLTMMDSIMGARGKEFLTDVPSSILSELLEAITGDASPLNVIHKIVKEADSTSTARDKQQTVAIYGGTGIPVERYYLSAIRRLVKEHRGWKPNQPGSRLWFIDKIPFLVWPAAGEDIGKLLKKDGVRGIPLDPETIAQEMLDRNLASPYIDEENGESRMWPILPKALDGVGKGRVQLGALRLNSVDTLAIEGLESAEGRYGAEALRETAKAGSEGDAKTGPETERETPAAGGAEAPESLDATERSGAVENRGTEVPDGAYEAMAESAGADAIRESGEDDAPPEPSPEKAPEPHAKPEPVEASRLRPKATPSIPSGEPSRIVKAEDRVEVTAEVMETFFRKNKFIGHLLEAFVDELNRMKKASPDIATVEYDLVNEDGEVQQGDHARIVCLRAPDFFVDFYPDMELMRQTAEKSGVFLRNANGELPFALGDQGEEWWRLNDFASQCVLRKAAKYRQMLSGKKKRGEPGARAEAKESRINDDLTPKKPKVVTGSDTEAGKESSGKRGAGKREETGGKDRPSKTGANTGADTPAGGPEGGPREKEKESASVAAADTREAGPVREESATKGSAGEPHGKRSGSAPGIQIGRRKSESDNGRKGEAVSKGRKPEKAHPKGQGAPISGIHSRVKESEEHAEPAHESGGGKEPAPEAPGDSKGSGDTASGSDKAPSGGTENDTKGSSGTKRKKRSSPSAPGHSEKAPSTEGEGTGNGGSDAKWASKYPDQDRLGYSGARQRSKEEKRQDRAVVNQQDNPTPQEKVVDVSGQKIRIQNYGSASGTPDAEGDTGRGNESGTKTRKGGIVEVTEVESTSSKTPRADSGKALREAIEKWVEDRWDCGLKTFRESDLLEAISEATGERVREHKVRTILRGLGIRATRFEGESGHQITKDAIHRIREGREE